MLLNCQSSLRFIRPELFQHCNTPVCTYSPFSNWKAVPGSEVSVPPGVCRSGQAQTRSRSQSAPEIGCVVRTESRQECKLYITEAPIIDFLLLHFFLLPCSGILTGPEKLIHTFNLGIPASVAPNTTLIRERRQTCPSPNLCQNIPSTPRRK